MLVVALDALTPAGVEIVVEEAEIRWHEILRVAPKADEATLRGAMTRLPMLYHPDKGGQPEQMIRVTAAYERALRESPR